jgi:hypothetical protein
MQKNAAIHHRAAAKHKCFYKLFENSLFFFKICDIIYKLKKQLRKKGKERVWNNN